MRRSTIAIVTILIVILTIAIAIIASDNAQYSNPITIENGKAMIATTNGMQSYSDVEYISGKIVSVKPSAIATIKPSNNAPSALPNTSAPHGDHTCDMGKYTVTTDEPCENLK